MEFLLLATLTLSVANVIADKVTPVFQRTGPLQVDVSISDIDDPEVLHNTRHWGKYSS